MGRSYYFSYTPTPAIRTEPEPKVDVCEKWSAWNRFDPDSEEFFRDAQWEAFTDSAQFVREQATIEALAAVEVNSDTSDSTESSVSDQDSPMAEGSDDPAILIADAYTTRTARWEDDLEDVSPVETEWQPTSADSDTIFTSANLPLFSPHSPPVDLNQQENPAFIPPPDFRESTSDPSDVPRSSTLRRSVNITPIHILSTQVETEAPSTPPPLRHQQEVMLTPSPPPSVTPRFYSWQNHGIPTIRTLVPTSPSLVRGNRDGPLTNPRARMSFARIDSSPVRVRIPGSVM